MGTYEIASIHKDILKAHIEAGNSGGCHCFQYISKTDVLKTAVSAVHCKDSDSSDKEILDFLKKNHIELNENQSDWGWEPGQSNPYKRNCIILREFINKINTIPLHSFVRDLYYDRYKGLIENQILSVYTKVLCTQKGKHFDALEEAKKAYYISHFLIEDYTIQKRLGQITAAYAMPGNFSFISNDAEALGWWESQRDKMENNYSMRWLQPPEKPADKPADLVNFRRASTNCARERYRFFSTDEKATNALDAETLILADFIFGTGHIAGEIVDSLNQTIMSVKQEFFEKYTDTCEYAWKLPHA